MTVIAAVRRSNLKQIKPKVYKADGKWCVFWRHRGDVVVYKSWQIAYSNAFIWRSMIRRMYGV